MELQPSLMDLLGIIVILVIIFGATALPQMGEWIGRRIAHGRGLPLPPRPGEKTARPDDATSSS